jgi:hypothetical protein
MDDEQNLATIKSLRVRASRFRYVAFIALGVSVALLIAAIYLFLYASELSFRDNVNLLELKSIQINELSKQRDALNLELKKAQDRYLAEVQGVGGTRLPGEGPVARQLKERMNNLEVQLSEMDARIAFESKVQNEGKQNEISMSQVVTTSVTRIIVLGTLIFLVQILVNLYKYNMRVAGHYESIADTLILTGASMSGESFANIAELLSTNRIDFGATPSSVINQAVDLMKIANNK